MQGFHESAGSCENVFAAAVKHDIFQEAVKFYFGQRAPNVFAIGCDVAKNALGNAAIRRHVFFEIAIDERAFYAFQVQNHCIASGILAGAFFAAFVTLDLHFGA